jgi:hypothetical protein
VGVFSALAAAAIATAVPDGHRLVQHCECDGFAFHCSWVPEDGRTALILPRHPSAKIDVAKAADHLPLVLRVPAVRLP